MTDTFVTLEMLVKDVPYVEQYDLLPLSLDSDRDTKKVSCLGIL